MALRVLLRMVLLVGVVAIPAGFLVYVVSSRLAALPVR